MRKLGITLIAVGLLLPAWLAFTLWQGDPLTASIAARAQASLRRELAGEQVERRDGSPARPYRPRAGHAWGRLLVERLGLDVIVVQGTSPDDLRRGPGHYSQTVAPGSGTTIAIAGHRTTFGAPFRHIDSLQRGDRVALVMPYGVFRYRVSGHRVVAADDWSVIRPRRTETLVLSACHPLFSASQRWIVLAAREPGVAATRRVSPEKSRPERPSRPDNGWR